MLSADKNFVRFAERCRLEAPFFVGSSIAVPADRSGDGGITHRACETSIDQSKCKTTHYIARRSALFLLKFGGAEEDRTPDLRIANQKDMIQNKGQLTDI
ncbi:hypothetical protein [Burkholderia ambifaria]|uniref:hypothetical protein n=1 Tax=Burkholderia ambifaria TaxID=152480 RepID=UPI00158D2986|nr:hypothetical protein [Burkholderia ambifaria]